MREGIIKTFDSQVQYFVGDYLLIYDKYIYDGMPSICLGSSFVQPFNINLLEEFVKSVKLLENKGINKK